MTALLVPLIALLLSTDEATCIQHDDVDETFLVPHVELQLGRLMMDSSIIHWGWKAPTRTAYWDSYPDGGDFTYIAANICVRRTHCQAMLGNKAVVTKLTCTTAK